MVGTVDKQEKIRRVLKVFILKEREKERRNELVEAEKTRKKKKHDEKKLKEKEECKSIETKLSELSKIRDKLQQSKNRILDHLKKVREDAEHPIQIEDLTKLYSKGVAVTHVGNASNSLVHSVTAPVTILPRVSAVSIVSNQYKMTISPSAKVHPMLVQKRNRSPSPTIFHRPPYNYKVAAGPHPFQKLEEPRRNHELHRSYLYSTHTEDTVCASLKHSSPYPPHLSSLSRSSPSIQSNHVSYLVDHGKSGPSYLDDKYYLMRPGPQMSVHGSVIPIQPPPSPQVNKHSSITSGFSIRSPSTQIGGPLPVHIQPSHTACHLDARSQQSPVTHLQGLSHHQPSAVHYPPPPPSHTQSQFHHSSQPPPFSVTVPSHHHQPSPHIQQLRVPSHHRPPPNSHLQIISHHASPSIHHSSSHQHLQSTVRHQQALPQSRSHHSMPHSQSLHHQSHVQHILSHGQQSQPTSTVTSQAYVHQLNAMEQGNRVAYRHTHSHSPLR